MMMRRHLTLIALLFAAGNALAALATQPTTQPADCCEVPEQIDGDDFRSGTGRWRAELEDGGTISAKDRTLDIDVPAGTTLWFDRELEGPIVIEYEATVVSAGGPNDRVSDLNCFWMASDARSPADLFATKRTGKFVDYNALFTYYASNGGNENTTTRFRRYIGSPSTRPLAPEHDLRDAAHLLVPNHAYQIRLVADGELIQFWRDGEKVFELHDNAPYTRGYFALRTVKSHLRIRNFRITRLAH
jgi:hypothetical protein